jgi:hypothetical protein
MNLENKDIAGAYRHVLLGIEFQDKTDISEMFLGDFLFATFLRKVLSTGTKEFKLQDIAEGWTSEPLKVSDIGFTDLKAESLPFITSISGERKEFRPVTVGEWITHLVQKKEFPTLVDMVRMMSDKSVEPDDIFDPMDVASLGEAFEMVKHGFDKTTVTITKEDESHQIEVDLNFHTTILVLPHTRP